MQGKIVVITGATSGIGLVTAEKIGRLGARLVLVGRDPVRGEAVLKELRAKISGLQVGIHYADLSRIAEMKRVGAEIAEAEPHIDVLINNAGAVFTTRQVTADGLEMTFALNHMAYFVVTHMLKDRLIGSAPARIVNVASDAHKGATLDFSDLQAAGSFSGFRVYGRSKLANILFTRELARRLQGTGVTANCLHPGFVASRFGDNNGSMFRLVIQVFWSLFAISLDRGADTSVYLASSPEAADKSGLYFVKSRPATPTKAAQDDESARRLWAESEKLAGITA